MNKKTSFPWTRANKYKAVRSLSSDGKSFASKLECAVYDVLRLRCVAREIMDIRCQQVVRLTPDINWKIDFSFTDLKTGELAYAEAKGIEDNLYRMKLKLYRKYMTTKLEIWKGSYKKPFLYETINF